MKISLVIPVFNETSILRRTHRSVKAFLDDFGPGEAEGIYVDDGSSDGSFEVLEKLCLGSSQVFKLVRHHVNCGQHCAVLTGMRRSTGDLVLTADADLQTPLWNFQTLLNAMESGDSVISGIRIDRTDPLPRKIISFFLNAQLSFLFRNRIKDIGSMFKCYRKNAVQDILKNSNKNTFVPALAMKLGYTIKEVPVRQESPVRKSRYDLARLSRLYLRLAVEVGLPCHLLIFAFSVFIIIFFAELVIMLF
ncbi:glycosyltransferase [candidate division WOR-3 bacterium]|nr:glycosyltransferase [candidate division WOR-3 bacterium]